jgi:hypothetical protein
MKLKTRACLFVSRNGGFAVHNIEPPLEEQYQIPPVPPGMRHALKVLGLLSTVRVYKQTADGVLPVYEEI